MSNIKLKNNGGGSIILTDSSNSGTDRVFEFNNTVYSAQLQGIVKLTQAQYDALTPDANTLYLIVG